MPINEKEQQQPASIFQTHLPEFGPDLITALARLNMNDLSHLDIVVVTTNRELIALLLCSRSGRRFVPLLFSPL
jgi:hypothetical protein